MLNTPDSFRANFAEFRRRVLEKAHKDITQKTKLYFEWEPIKKGRAVISVRFIFSKKRAIPVSNAKSSEDQQRQSQKNNTNFKTAFACFQERGSGCVGGHQKKTICDICLKIRPEEHCQK